MARLLLSSMCACICVDHMESETVHGLVHVHAARPTSPGGWQTAAAVGEHCRCASFLQECSTSQPQAMSRCEPVQCLRGMHCSARHHLSGPEYNHLIHALPCPGRTLTRGQRQPPLQPSVGAWHTEFLHGQLPRPATQQQPNSSFATLSVMMDGADRGSSLLASIRSSVSNGSSNDSSGDAALALHAQLLAAVSESPESARSLCSLLRSSCEELTGVMPSKAALPHHFCSGSKLM